MGNTKSDSRDLGLNHGPGKGDAPRNMGARFRENFGEIKGLSGLPSASPVQVKSDGFESTRRGWRKVYR